MHWAATLPSTGVDLAHVIINKKKPGFHGAYSLTWETGIKQLYTQYMYIIKNLSKCHE